MELLILNILLLVLLGGTVYQDFKYREIHVLLIVGIFFVALGLVWITDKELLAFLRPFLFVVVVTAVLWSYISIRQKKLINPFDHHIGLGDILFFAAITPLFDLHSYILFFISSMILAISFSLVFKEYVRQRLIPLAGILACLLMFLKIISWGLGEEIFYKFNFLMI